MPKASDPEVLLACNDPRCALLAPHAVAGPGCTAVHVFSTKGRRVTTRAKEERGGGRRNASRVKEVQHPKLGADICKHDLLRSSCFQCSPDAERLLAAAAFAPGDVVVRCYRRKSGGWVRGEAPCTISRTYGSEVEFHGMPGEWWPAQWYKRAVAPLPQQCKSPCPRFDTWTEEEHEPSCPAARLPCGHWSNTGNPCTFPGCDVGAYVKLKAAVRELIAAESSQTKGAYNLGVKGAARQKMIAKEKRRLTAAWILVQKLAAES